jgi:hypothetical protein
MSDLDFEFDTEPLPEKVERPPLTDFDIEVLSYTEQLYWLEQAIPTYERLAEAFQVPVGKIKKVWEKEGFLAAIQARGLDLGKRAEGILSPKQIILVNMLLNVGDRASLREKLALIDVTQSQYYAWLRDPTFQHYLRSRTETMFESADSDAFKALVQAVMDGDVPAMKLFFEMRGIYNPKLQLDINVETVMYRVVEIVAKHVKDPVAIEAIAADMEELTKR